MSLDSNMLSFILVIMEVNSYTTSTISYQERVAWVSLAAFTLPYIFYFAWLGFKAGPVAQMPVLNLMLPFALAAGSSALVYGLGRLWLWLRFRDDARLPLDERDRAIARRSLSVAYGILIAGMIVVGGLMPFSRAGWEIVHPAVAFILLAEIVNHGTTIWLYRRGCHD